MNYHSSVDEYNCFEVRLLFTKYVEEY